MTISILASVIPPVLVPINEGSGQIILRLQGCSALITRTLPFGSTQAIISAAAQSMQAEWAGQQALCNALLVQGVNCNTGSGFIDVCNDAQTVCCPGFGPVFPPANMFCQRLNITGLNQSQINAAVAVIKANLNQQAITVFCPFFGTFCSITETFLSAGSTITLIGHNQSATLTFDSSTFQIRDNNGSFFNSLHATIAPNTSVVLQSIQGPFTAQPFTIWYNGSIIFTDHNGNGGLSRQVDVFGNCGPPPPPPC